MGKTITVLELCERVLSSIDGPLDTANIWEKAIEMGLVTHLEVPPKEGYWSLGRSLSDDTARSGSIFYHLAGDEYGLKRLMNRYPEQAPRLDCPERNLHPLLVRYLHTDFRFNAYAKTIDPSRAKPVFGTYGGFSELSHPDMVGIRFPFRNETKGEPGPKAADSLRFFSFELRKNLTLANLHQSYFETVANSSWANEGYLVVGSIDQYEDTFAELTRLNSAFGIGVIRLNLANADQSEIVLQSRVNTDRNKITFHRMVESHPDFCELVEDAGRSLLDGKIGGGFDQIFSDEELMDFIEKNHIH